MTAWTNIVYWKDKDGAYLGYYDFCPEQSAHSSTNNNFIGKTDYDIYPPHLAELYRQQDLEVMETGRLGSYEITLPENPTILQALKQPMRDEQGEIIGVIINVNNLTAIAQQFVADSSGIKKLVKEAIGTAVPNNLNNIEYVEFLRDYLENIIALMPGHVYWQDRNNIFLGCNNLQAKSAKLQSRKDIIGKTNYDMLWKAQADELNNLNNKVMETGKPYTAEEYAVMDEGPGIYLSQKVPLRDPQGNVVGIVGISFNITDRKKAEEERLNLILKASNMGTWVWNFNDDTFIHEYIHHETPYRFTGTMQEAIARAHPADQDSLRHAMLLAYNEGAPLDIEYRLLWLNGQTLYIAMRGKVLEASDGKPSHMVGICWDITQRKEVEKVLQQQQIDLAQIARLNSMGELASTLSHELNQPLAAISNYLKGCLIRLKSGNYKIDEILNAMEQASTQSARAGEIIHRMKNFIRKGKLYYEMTDLNHIIEETVNIIRLAPAANTVSIHLDLSQTLPPLEVDKIQIGQVISNLLRNAVEAIQQNNISNPEIIIKTRCNNNKVYVDIIDNGPGCPPELIAKLFTPYFTTKTTGTGMGLAICRTIIEAHSGHLTILDNPDSGAWFQFSLPVKKVTSMAQLV